MFDMPRIAMPLAPEFLEQVAAIFGAEVSDLDGTPLGESAYIVLTPISDTEFNLKLMTEDEIFEEAKNDPDMTIAGI